MSGDSNGWYFWSGKILGQSEDFFNSMHVEHLADYLPELTKYLNLPPGYRVLVHCDGYEDIWYDESLLTV
ncbi:MAG: hypothetical protein AB8G16_19415 [Gammaproteobacteria bacterium]